MKDLGMKVAFSHQDLQTSGLKLNKQEEFSTSWSSGSRWQDRTSSG